MDTQLRKGVLDICVLATLEKEPMYGYGLKQEMNRVIEITENTLYSLLRRLQLEGYLETYIDSTYSDKRVRKYYRLTSSGKKHLESLKRDWEEFKAVCDSIIGGESSDD